MLSSVNLGCKLWAVWLVVIRVTVMITSHDDDDDVCDDYDHDSSDDGGD